MEQQMKTSLLGILVVSSAVGWVAVACRSDTDPTAPPASAGAGGAGGAGGISLNGVAGAETPPVGGGSGGASLDGVAGASAVNANAGSGGIGPGGVNSGLDPEMQVNQLTQAEVGQLCRAIAPPALEVATNPDKSRGSCVLTIIQTQFVHTLTTLEQCQQDMARCDAAVAPAGQVNLSAPVPSVLAAGMSCVSATPIVNSTCRATVGELEGCMTAGVGALGIANQVTCDSIMSGAASRQVAQSLGNSGVLTCQGYKSKCPDGFTGGNGGSSSGIGGSSALAGMGGTAS